MKIIIIKNIGFAEQTLSNDENYNKMLRGTTLTESLYKYKIGEIEAVADETQKPSKIN